MDWGYLNKLIMVPLQFLGSVDACVLVLFNRVAFVIRDGVSLGFVYLCALFMKKEGQ